MATIDEVNSIELSLEQKVSPSEPATLTVQVDGESGKSWIWLYAELVAVYGCVLAICHRESIAALHPLG